MATAFIDKESLAQVIGTTFDNATVRPLRPNYVFDALAKEKEWNLNRSPIRGDVIQFPVLTAWSANTTALDPTATLITGSQTLTNTRRTVSLTPYGDHTVIDTFESHPETFIDDISDAAYSLTDQAANSLNVLARASMDLNKYSDETSGTLSNTYHYYGSYGAGSGTAGPLKAVTVREVISDLRGANVKPYSDGWYRWIINPVQYTQLRADSDNSSWTDAANNTDRGNAMIARGEVGVFEGCMFIVNNEVSGATGNTISSYAMGQEFVGKAIGKDVSVATNNQMYGSQDNLMVMHWNALVGYKIIRREAGRIIETSSSQL